MRWSGPSITGFAISSAALIVGNILVGAGISEGNSDMAFGGSLLSSGGYLLFLATTIASGLGSSDVTPARTTAPPPADNSAEIESLQKQIDLLKKKLEAREWKDPPKSKPEVDLDEVIDEETMRKPAVPR